MSIDKDIRNLMRQAILKTEEGIGQGQTPFGALIVRHRDGEILAVAHNTVWRDTDPTAHAEVNAIRMAAKRAQTIELTGCSMVTTCEPCPMCLSAIHWAKIDSVYYGAEIADAEEAGFSELRMPAKQLAQIGGSPLKVVSDCLSDECRKLFSVWKAASGKRY